MTVYSFDGYLAALKIREEPTVLVEGDSDCHVVCRILSAIMDCVGVDRADVFVDPASILRDPALPSGNRNIVEHVYAASEVESLSLAAFVDREFREFVLRPPLSDAAAAHFFERRLFWTRGHSTENYFFSDSFVVSFVRNRFPRYYSMEFHRSVTANLDRVLRFGAAASLAGEAGGLLSRMTDICSMDCWLLEEVGIGFDLERYAAKLAVRGASLEVLEDFRQRFSEIVEALTSAESAELARWICHGHIGWNFVWSGAGFLFAEHGAPSAPSEQVAHGFNDEKLSHVAGLWADGALTEVYPAPQEFIQWMRESLEEAA